MVDLAYDFAGCILYAAGINCFIMPQNFASGGVSGIALIITYLTGLPNGTLTFIINIPLIIISYKILLQCRRNLLRIRLSRCSL